MSKSLWYTGIFIVVAFITLAVAVFILGTKYRAVQEAFEAGQSNGTGSYAAPSGGSSDTSGISDATVSIGKSITFGELEITLNAIPQDSRCPVDVVCMQAGGITTSVTLVVGAHRETVTLSPEKMPKVFDGYRISVPTVEPAKISSNTISPEDYRVTFHVERIY